MPESFRFKLDGPGSKGGNYSRPNPKGTSQEKRAMPSEVLPVKADVWGVR